MSRRSRTPDDEVDAILKESELLNGGTHGYAAKSATFRLLLELMLSTGMRVGDAVCFDPRFAGERGNPMGLHLHAAKAEAHREAEGG